MTRDPNFAKFADEVIEPADLSTMTGWTNGDMSEKQAFAMENLELDRLEDDMPVAFRKREAKEPIPAIWEKWVEFQKSKGRSEGSNDLSIIDEFMFGKDFAWKPQIIGSCVMSNTFREYVARMMYEIGLLGVAEEYIGLNEFGPDNFSFYCPWSYGMARRRANMRGGDGLYCAPMAESLLKDGVLPCSTPKLLELTRRLGVNGDTDYPEPQSKRVYRAFGNWQYLDELKPYSAYPVEESVRVNNVDQLWDLLGEGKPAFVCSMEAIRKVSEHKDGFPIHARNPYNRWAHNMGVIGRILASDSRRFFVWNNTSWGRNHVYIREADEVQSSFNARRLTMMSIGEVRAPASMPQFEW